MTVLEAAVIAGLTVFVLAASFIVASVAIAAGAGIVSACRVVMRWAR